MMDNSATELSIQQLVHTKIDYKFYYRIVANCMLALDAYNSYFHRWWKQGVGQGLSYS